jgi:monoamine oxidase
VVEGYGALVKFVVAELQSREVPIHYNTIVRGIRWDSGRVEVEASTPTGLRFFQGNRVVITLPLGVLKENGSAAVAFEPAVPGMEEAVSQLEMGFVTKVVMEFRTRFWPEENFGFVHSPDEWLPTWWADERGLVLTGWAGGPRADWLSREHPQQICEEATRALCEIFHVSRQSVEDATLKRYLHDWTNDPFSRGAYSYTPVDMMEMPRRLAAPVQDTLWFAGEATDGGGEQGTVHGALASGRRAAQEITKSIRGQRAGVIISRAT